MSLCERISVGTDETAKKAMKNVFTQTFGHFEDCRKRSATAGSLITSMEIFTSILLISRFNPHSQRRALAIKASPAEVEAENNIVKMDLTGDLGSLSLASCCSDHNSWFSSGLEVVLL